MIFNDVISTEFKKSEILYIDTTNIEVDCND